MQTRVCKDERTWQHRPQASALNPWSLCQVGLEQRLANAKKKASQMEELLPTQVIIEDHREVLRLLCRARELELENMGLQANSLCRRNLLCQKDFVIQRCQQHRRLCEQIIREQQQLIQGEAPPHRPLLGPPSLSGLLSGKATPWWFNPWVLGREDPLEKGMATHTSILAWRIPWTQEPGRLQSLGSHSVRHD